MSIIPTRQNLSPIHYSQGGVLPKSSLNAMSSRTNDIRAGSGITIQTLASGGLQISASATASGTTMSFEVSLSGTTVSITAGSIWFDDAAYDITGADVTLTGSTEYVYVYHEKDHSASGFGHSSSAPLSNGSQWRWPLVKYTNDGSGYVVSGGIRHRGDFYMQLPIASG